MPHTLSTLPQKDSIQRILQAALNAADPALVIQRSLHLKGSLLSASGVQYELAKFPKIHLLSVGKAGEGLAAALESLLGGFLARGLVIAKVADHTPLRLSAMLTGGHPVPDERSLAAGKAVIDFLSSIGSDDLLICAISGGASALIAAPYSPIALAELQTLTSLLLACGAPVSEINTLRRHLDLLKGGGFLRQTQATVLSLILSDAIGNDLHTIASGPTAPDPSTCADALQILQKYDLTCQVSPNILAVLQNSAETLKPGDVRLQNVHNLLIGSNLMAIHAALRQVADEGLRPYLLRANLSGEARDAAFELCGALRWACQRGEPVTRPFCMVAGGETTVTLRGDGRGGRNTELALAAVTELADFPDVLFITLATDGEDGPTDAAGAIVNGESWRRAKTLGLGSNDHLQRNDSYSFFAALDDLIKIGPTGTNVNDLVFLFGF